MTIKPFTYVTGPSIVPDVGTLFYNGCFFSPLFESNISGRCVQDEAQRTTMYMEYTITVDGYVTLPEGLDSTDPVMRTLRRMLTAHAGELRYEGRGNNIIVNVPGKGHKDVKWGPIPQLLEFQPLGAGKCAKVKWTVKVQIVEIGFDLEEPGGGGRGRPGGGGEGRPGGGDDLVPVNPGDRPGGGPGKGGGGPGGGGGIGAFFVDGGRIVPGPSRIF